MWISTGTLLSAMENLEQAIAPDPGRGPRVWAARVDQALFGVEQAIRGEGAVITAAADGNIDPGNGQTPSPGMDRRVDHLRDELADLLDEAASLRGQVRQVLEGISQNPLAPAVFTRFRSRIDDLLNGLGTYEQEETRLILETTSTDIGAGD